MQQCYSPRSTLEVSVGGLLSIRLREGFTIKSVAFSKGASHFQFFFFKFFLKSSSNLSFFKKSFCSSFSFFEFFQIFFFSIFFFPNIFSSNFFPLQICKIPFLRLMQIYFFPSSLKEIVTLIWFWRCRGSRKSRWNTGLALFGHQQRGLLKVSFFRLRLEDFSRIRSFFVLEFVFDKFCHVFFFSHFRTPVTAEIHVEAPYEFLYDLSCPALKSSYGKFRLATLKQFKHTVQGWVKTSLPPF